MSTQAPAAAPQPSASATKDAGAMQKRIEELRVQARGLMDLFLDACSAPQTDADGCPSSLEPIHTAGRGRALRWDGCEIAMQSHETGDAAVPAVLADHAVCGL